MKSGWIFELSSVQFQQDRWIENIVLPVSLPSWTAILGRSGIGKTTLLKAMAGLQGSSRDSAHPMTVSSQWFTQARQPVLKPPRVIWMSQQSSLLPWATALENVMIGDRLRGAVTSKSTEKALNCLDLVGMAAAAALKPSALSGGMQQRVSLARVLFEEGDIVCLDEPFSALDVVTKTELYPLMKQCLRQKSVIQITHDPEEAIALADHLYVLAGRPATLRGPFRGSQDANASRNNASLLLDFSGKITCAKEIIEIMSR